MAGLGLRALDDFGAVYEPSDVSDSAAPRPGVVILHGSEGPWAGWAHRFAAILAAHGLAALPLGYGEGDLWGAGPILEVDLRRVHAAGRALAARLDGGRVGLLGWSKGAEAALLAMALAGDDTPFTCIAAHAAPDIVTPAFDPEARRAGRRWDTASPTDPRAWVWPGEEAALTPGKAIPASRIARPVFLSVGTADAVWDPHMVLRLAERLRGAGNPPDLMVAEGQGHGFDWDTEPQFWARLLGFFSRHLGPP